MNNQTTLDKSVCLAQDYESIHQFTEKYNDIAYIQFDYYTVNKMNLFTIHENFDFDFLEKTIDKIMECLPSIKRIFAKPIIHLKDQDAILPVESVRVVNNETITHASFHSELWENITSEGIKPRKLLTRNNQDDYSIYENVAFAYAIRTILSFIHRNARELKDFMYTNKNLDFNLLERVDHINYYLAIGKLHTGYIRNFEKYYVIIDRCINKMNFIDNVISSRLMRPVYKKNSKIKKGKFTLRKTNILRMHKDYHQVYNLLKYFLSNNIEIEEDMDDEEMDKMLPNYVNYVKIITLFSIGHFNYTADENDKINFGKLNITFNNHDWRIKVTSDNYRGIEYIRLKVSKELSQDIIFVPWNKPSSSADTINIIKKGLKISKIVLVSPYEEEENALYVSINNIDSFRRIQQLIYRSMIYVDKKKNICAFCGNEEKRIEKEDGTIVYECPSCRGQIYNCYCLEKPENSYYVTAIKDYKQFIDVNRRISEDESWLLKRSIESLMHYRNINKIDYNMDSFCPYCHKIHTNNFLIEINKDAKNIETE